MAVGGILKPFFGADALRNGVDRKSSSMNKANAEQIVSSNDISGFDVPSQYVESRASDDEILPALFWDGSENWVDEDNCADFSALQSLKHESTTPKERAEHYKAKGNEALKFKQNKLYVRKAVQLYTLALQETFDDSTLRSILHGNRAQADLILGNHRKAFIDAERCISFDPSNVKGWFRAAKSAFELDDPVKSIQVCSEGLELHPENEELNSLLDAARQAKKSHDRQLRRQQGLESRAKLYIHEIKKRGLQFGPPGLATGERFPELSAQHFFSYWVLFVYPEVMQTDIVEDFDERKKIGAQLDIMFGPDVLAPEWDTAGAYKRDRLEIYYITNSAQAYPSAVFEQKVLSLSCQGTVTEKEFTLTSKTNWEMRKKLVDETCTLGEILAANEHVISGHPVFYIVAQGTEFRERFLKDTWKL